MLFITVSGSLFIVTACLAVWKYGGNTTANILEAVPSGSVANIAILLAALQLCFSSVIGYSALFQHVMLNQLSDGNDAPCDRRWFFSAWL